MSSSAPSKGAWTPQEDAILLNLIYQHGPGNWHILCNGVPGRSAKSCRLRWRNQLSPEVLHCPFTFAEDLIIVQAHALYGNKWSKIASLLPGRTDNAVKNHWNWTLRRQLAAAAGEEVGSSSESNLVVNRPSPPAGESGVNKKLCLRHDDDVNDNNNNNNVNDNNSGINGNVGGEGEGEEINKGGPETSLTLSLSLSPPGRWPAKKAEKAEEAAEMEKGCLLGSMKSKIAEDVRVFIDDLLKRNN